MNEIILEDQKDIYSCIDISYMLYISSWEKMIIIIQIDNKR